MPPCSAAAKWIRLPNQLRNVQTSMMLPTLEALFATTRSEYLASLG